MDFLERWLKERSLVISLGLALLVTGLLGSRGVVGPDAMPYGDGERHAIRAFTLYGYLHTGQWGRFWDRFTFDSTSALAPLHYWIFFLLPPGWAGVTSYGVILGLSNYLLLAFGLWALCRVLDREKWAPLLFLICASQNLSLDFTYYYFSDLPFFALGTVAFAAQLRAWQRGALAAGILSGALAATLFLIKPGNAVIFAGTYFLAEILRAGYLIWQVSSGHSTARPPGLRTHLAGVALGFFPLLFLILGCGALQVIMSLADANEISDIYITELHCTGLLRLFYFPLCLTYFYNALLMAGVGAVVFCVARVCLRRLGMIPTGLKPEPFPWHGLAPLLIAYLIQGEYFSFGMDTKTMRSLLLVLPLLWLVVFRVVEHIGVRLHTLLLGIVVYVMCAYGQVFGGLLYGETTYAENYQLEDAWLVRLPPYVASNDSEIHFARFMLSCLHNIYPFGAKIAVGSDMLFCTAESLAWYEDPGLLLQGKPPIYHFNNFLKVDGSFYREALLGADGIILYILPNLQYSTAVTASTRSLDFYSQEHWENGAPVAARMPLSGVAADGSRVVIADLLVFKPSLTGSEIDDAVAVVHSPGYATDMAQFSARHEQRLSWDGCVSLVRQWFAKHMGLGGTP